MILYVNNSLNMDMEIYFGSKIDAGKNKFIFAGNKYSINRNRFSFITSFSKSNDLAFSFLVDFIMAPYIVFKILSKKIDTVIFDTVHISNLPLSFLLRLLNFQQIHTIHDLIPHEGKKNLKTKIYNSLIINFLATKLIFFSQPKLQIKKPFLILRLAGFEKKDVKKEGDDFLFFGRMEEYKGIDFLPLISHELKKLRPESSIRLLGSGNIPLPKKVLNDKNIIINNIKYSSKELESNIARSCAIICPYHSATQSGVIVEAFSFGRPVIAYDVGCIHEYVSNKTGALVEYGNIKDFVAKMIYFSDNFEKYSESVSNEFKKLYSHISVSNNLEKIVTFLDSK